MKVNDMLMTTKNKEWRRTCWVIHGNKETITNQETKEG